MSALALWSGLNLLLMLVLALNVSRLRIRNMKVKVDPVVLDKAVRAHGNNIEYVPAALFGMLVLVYMNIGSVWVHGLGATLFISRLLHAFGIQQITSGGPPPARIIGNLGTWAVLASVSVLLIVESLS
ncbi:MAG: MAPEG family protein [Pseudomonadota bacterium]